MSRSPNVLVVGAGSAGTTAALLLAAKGIRVTLADARKRENVGATWINGVEKSLFNELDLPTPPRDIFALHAHRFRMADPSCQAFAVVEDPPVAEVDMAALNRWLLAEAEAAGVTTRFATRVAIGDADATSRTARIGGRTEHFDVVVDAAGLSTPAARRYNAPVDLCSAYQGVWEVRHSGQARDWLHRLGTRDQETLSIVGVEGGYSVRNVCLYDGGTRLAILTGAMMRPGFRSGARIATDFARSQPWIGPRISGGGALIPLRPLDHAPVADRLVRIGNAAGQVFPQHGSGVAPGMRAAWHAAHAISAALQVGDADARGLWPYVHNYQSGPGAMCAHYQPLRYLAQSFTPAEARLLLEAGILSPRSLRNALAQKLAGADPRLLIGSVLRARELLPMAPRLATAGALGIELLRHWRAFPARGPGPEFDRWNERAERLLNRATQLAAYTPTDATDLADAAEDTTETEP